MIEVYVVSYAGSVPGTPTSAPFDNNGGTIGRGAGNQLTLPDPDRHLSRVQAKLVALANDAFEITNLSGANSMFVGPAELEPQHRTVANIGAELRMGLYVLGTRRAHASAGSAAALHAPVAPNPLSTVPDPFASVGLASASPARAPASNASYASPLSAPATSHTKTSASSAVTATRIPDDFDPFSLPSAAVRNSDNPIDALAQASDVSLREVFESATPVNRLVQNDAVPTKEMGLQPLFDDAASHLNDSVNSDPLKLFGGGSSKGEDPFAMLGSSNHSSELGAFLPLPKVSAVEPLSIDALVTPTATPSPSTTAADVMPTLDRQSDVSKTPSALKPPPPPRTRNSAVAEPAPVLDASAAPPKPDLIAEAIRPQKPSRASAASKRKVRETLTPDSAGEHYIRAFLEGAGVADLEIPDESEEEFLRRAGAMLRASIDGAVDLISARASTKREVRADVTMIVSRGNNPIKFAPDGEAAAMQLLGTPFPGFMPPLDSMHDAFDDLRAHQIGVIAGSRAAFASVLQRFDPGALEQKLGAGGVLDSLLPSARRAKLWLLYTELFREILKQAEDDYGALFTEAFRRAYETEVENVRTEKRERGAR